MRVLECLTYMRSTWEVLGLNGKPHFLGISDGSEVEWIGPDVLAFFAGRLRDPVARYFWDERFGAGTAPASLPALLHLQDGQPAPPELPPAAVYRDQPMAFGWRIGDSLMMLNNIREITGHGHRDRLRRDLRVRRRAAPPGSGQDRLRRPVGSPLQGERLPQHDHLRRP